MIDDQPFDSSIIIARAMIETVVLGVWFAKQCRWILGYEQQRILFQWGDSIFTTTKARLFPLINAIKQNDWAQIANPKDNNEEYTGNMDKVKLISSTSEERNDGECSFIKATTTIVVNNKTTVEDSNGVLLSIACKLATNHDYIFCHGKDILQVCNLVSSSTITNGKQAQVLWHINKWLSYQILK